MTININTTTNPNSDPAPMVGISATLAKKKNIVAELPSELAHRIFDYLPLKSLCQASIVSKEWRDRIADFHPISWKHQQTREVVNRICRQLPLAHDTAEALERRCYPFLENFPAQAVKRFCLGHHPKVLKLAINECTQALSFRDCVDLQKGFSTTPMIEMEAAAFRERDFRRQLPFYKLFAMSENIPVNFFPRIKNIVTEIQQINFTSFILLDDLNGACKIAEQRPSWIRPGNIYSLFEKLVRKYGFEDAEKWLDTYIKDYPEETKNTEKTECIHYAIHTLLAQENYTLCLNLLRKTPPSDTKDHLLNQMGTRLIKLIARSDSTEDKIQYFLIIDKLFNIRSTSIELTMGSYICIAYQLVDKTTRETFLKLPLSDRSRAKIDEFLSPLSQETINKLISSPETSGQRLFPDTIQEQVECYRAFTELEKSGKSSHLDSSTYSRDFNKQFLTKIGPHNLERTLNNITTLNFQVAATLAGQLALGSQFLYIENLARSIDNRFDAEEFASGTTLGKMFDEPLLLNSLDDIRQITKFLLNFSSPLPQSINSDHWDNLHVWTINHLIPFDIEASINLTLKISAGDQRNETLINIIQHLQLQEIAFHKNDFSEKIQTLLTALPDEDRTYVLFQLGLNHAASGSFSKCLEIIELLPDEEKDKLRFDLGLFFSLHGFDLQSLDIVEQISSPTEKRLAFINIGCLQMMLKTFEHGEMAYLRITPTEADTREKLLARRLTEGFFIAIYKGDFQQAEILFQDLPIEKKPKARIALQELYEKVQKRAAQTDTSESISDDASPRHKRKDAEAFPGSLRKKILLDTPETESLITHPPEPKTFSESLIALAKSHIKQTNFDALRSIAAIGESISGTVDEETEFEAEDIMIDLIFDFCKTCIDLADLSDNDALEHIVIMFLNSDSLIKVKGVAWKKYICKCLGSAIYNKDPMFNMNQLCFNISIFSELAAKQLQRGFDLKGF
ncbi:MAG: F-box protein [Parachlamydiaceae bacterium]